MATFLLGVGTSLFASGVLLLSGKVSGTNVPKRFAGAVIALGSALAAAAFLLGLDLHYVVPDLGNTQLTEAANRLAQCNLRGVAIPVETDSRIGIVLSDTQSIPAGQLAARATTISFNVSDRGTNELSFPTTNHTAECVQRPQGFCVIEAEGTPSELVRRGLLTPVLWAKSESSQWFAQGEGSGKTALDRSDGSWIREVQVGNSQERPRDGEVVSLALTVMLPSSAAELTGPSNKPQGHTVGEAERVTIKIVEPESAAIVSRKQQ